jgi:hypothetical protein
MEKIRAQWNAIDQRTTQQILELLSEEQRAKLAPAPWQVLDFDSRLKAGSQISSTDPRFQNLNSQELFQSFFPPNPKVRFVPATALDSQ